MRRNSMAHLILLKKRASAVLVKPQDINHPPATPGGGPSLGPSLKAMGEHTDGSSHKVSSPITRVPLRLQVNFTEVKHA